MGRSFAAGTTDGPGTLGFSQGWVLLGIVVSVANVLLIQRTQARTHFGI